mmetsp:Transcript_60209/g.138122  ORF Transcript_60209/g.138122 Transcript_60209/m.138122 type:complete len:1002 (-) Transcript_60209:651-3656(-)
MATTTRLQIDGMTCPHCVAKVEAALQAVPSVISVSVSLDDSLAIVLGSAQLDKLIDAVDSIGFGARLTPVAAEVRLVVDGMMCGHCVAKVHSVLCAVKGVASADVILEDKMARVRGTARPDALVAAIEGVGFGARVEDGGAGVRSGSHMIQISESRSDGNNVLLGMKEWDDGSVVGGHGETEMQTRRLLAQTQMKASDSANAPADSSELETALLAVDGMTCDNCRALVERRVRALKGVSTVTVSVIAKRAQVCYDASVISPQQLVNAVEHAGYGAALLSRDGAYLSTGAGAADEAAMWRRQFVGSLFFAVPIFLLAMILPHTPANRAISSEVVPGLPVRELLLWVLVTPVQFGFGWQFFRRAARSLRHGAANMDVLVALGTSAAYGYSIFSIFVAISTRGEMGNNQACFETASMLISFILLGKSLEASAKRKTSEAIAKLVTLQPPTALRCASGACDGNLADTEPQLTPVESLQMGDVVKVLPGAQVPVDGVVLRGSSTVDESMVTGEPMPVAKAVSDQVVGGTINGCGVMYVRTGAVGPDSVLSKIMRVVSEAQMRRPKVQAFADQISSYFVPAVVALALLTWTVWFAVVAEGWLPARAVEMAGIHDSRTVAFMFGCAVLVIACPCAMGLATPTAVMVGSGVGAHHGILFKGGDVLEKGSRVDTVIFDKTGTLTTCHLQVSEVESWAEGLSSMRLLELAASAESASEHPIGKAIHAHAKANSLTLCEPAAFQACAGQGLSCKLNDSVVVLGNREWLLRHGIRLSAEQERRVTPLEDQGQTVVLLSISGALGGMIALSDELKPEAAAVLALLDSWGLAVWIVSGDNARTTRQIAKQLGVTNVLAETKPADKAEKVQELQRSGACVAMIGDGINDAPALAQADVGVAIGGGTDVAIETADVVLLKGSLTGVSTALHLARAVMRRIRLNFVWAFGYNVVGIPMAAGVFYPLWQIHLPPMFAGAAMALSSVSVVGSSLLLRLYAPPKLLTHRPSMHSAKALFFH